VGDVGGGGGVWGGLVEAGGDNSALVEKSCKIDIF